MQIITTILSVLFFLSFANANDVILKDGGKIVSKVDSQKLGPMCTAEREWIELEGLPNQRISEKINASIRKEISVGRKLNAKDCLLNSEGKPEFPNEKIDFYNSTKLTGKRKSAIGIETFIYFPGGSGRRVSNCHVYKLKTGDKLDLGSFVTKEGEKIVADAICTWAKKTPSDEPKLSEIFCDNLDSIKQKIYSSLQYCLMDSGIEVRFWTANQSNAKVAIDAANSAKALSGIKLD